MSELLEKAKKLVEELLEKDVNELKKRWKKWVLKEKDSKKAESK